MLLVLVAPSTSYAKGLKLLFLGDSLTAGLGVEQDQAYPIIVQRKLKKAGHPNVEVVNASVSGSTSASLLERLKWSMKNNISFDFVIIALGANDVLRGLPVKSIKENLVAGIDFVLEKKTRPILVGMLAPPNYGPSYAREFKQLFSQLAKEKTLLFVPFLLESVAGVAKFNQADGIHPNESGHELMANNILGVLLPAIEKNREKK